MKKSILAILCGFFTWTTSHAQSQYIVGQTYQTADTYAQYVFGDMPVIISAPHGGTQKPAAIPTRSQSICGLAVTTGADTYTNLLAADLGNALKVLMGKTPHQITCQLSRDKVDMNREINEAACNNTIAQGVWNAYHQYVYTAKTTLMASFGRGLLIDLHGHGHTIQRNELGYNLSGSTLRGTDNGLNAASIVKASSIKNLSAHNLTLQTHAQLIRGNAAFGTLLQSTGYSSVPSQQQPAPAIADDYFSGGYNIERWGSKDSAYLDAIQIETPYSFRDTDAHRKRFADSLAVVIKRYLDLNYFSTALPNNTIYFSSTLSDKTVQQQWSTNNNLAIRQFELESSADSINFVKIAEVPAAGLLSIGSYSYLNTLTTEKQVYYRIKQVNLDATIYYSPVRKVVVPQYQGWQLLQNPVQGQATITCQTGGIYRLINSFGSLVAQGTFVAGINTLTLMGKSAGVYYLSGALANQQLKFIISQ